MCWKRKELDQDEIALNLLSVSDAQDLMLEHFKPIGKERIHISRSLTRVLGETIVSPINLPSFSNSSMDGFAVLSSDVKNVKPSSPRSLKVVGDVPAGKVSPKSLRSGEAIRVMTGAAVPAGADAVIPVELTDYSIEALEQGLPDFVRIYEPVEKGSFIRLVGEDIEQHDVVLTPGKILRPQEVGFLAMLGISEIDVHRRPRVGLFSTGDELTPLSERLAVGKIYDSNTYSLSALIEDSGGDVVNLGVAPDDPLAVEQLLNEAVENNVDLILTSAGVSVGAFDYVRMVIEKNGALAFWRINMRPGKPLAFGSYQDVPFVGLPGNPVSAFVCFEVFVRPVIRKMLGCKEVGSNTLKVSMAESIQSDGRESYLRAHVWQDRDRYLARLVEHQGSGNLYALVKANAFVIVPSEVKSLPIGAEVDAWFFHGNRFESQ